MNLIDTLYVEYIEKFVEKKFNLVIPFAKEEIRSFSEISVVDNDPENIINQRQTVIINFIKMNGQMSMQEIANILKTSPSTIKRDFQQLKGKGIIEREGGDKGGHWKIN